MAGIRPSEFKQETADAVCERISQGESLRSICRDESMPAASCIFKWLSRFKDFEEQYTRAREASADALFDDIIDIADEPPDDAVQVAHARLRVEARKWAASKLKPKKYGDKITTEHSGSVSIERIERVIIKPNE
jgi:transposase-like protein